VAFVSCGMATLFDSSQDAFGRIGAVPAARETPAEPAPAEAPVLTVSELCGGVRGVLEHVFDDVTVEGELSNVHLHRSGHLYFTLRDEDAQLRGVMWRSNAARVFFRVENGQHVRLRGRVSFYEARGEVQIVGHTLTLAGEGALLAALEALKDRLRAEGLFAHERKRPLPAYPSRVGLVTSASGAAVRDLVAVLGQRFPLCEAVLCGVAVQGLTAGDEIAAAIARFGALPEDDPLRPDVLIVGRGGGSVEDLWAFNEEVVARAIAASPIPVVSAVGHESDVTVADFVADVRAATPTHAAELVVPDAREVAALLSGYLATLREGVRARLADTRRALDVARHALDTHATARLTSARARLAAGGDAAPS
jgi:exodeoxyribonuclease VII large subunit